MSQTTRFQLAQVMKGGSRQRIPARTASREARHARTLSRSYRCGVTLLHALALLIGLGTPDGVRADTVINFDSLPALGNPVSGAALADYLAGFGVTVSDVTPGTVVQVYDARDIYPDIQPVIPPSPFNVISQSGSLDPVSYTLNFAQNQDHFSVTRTGVRAGTTGVALPAWHAYAYDSSNNLLGTVGENAYSIFTDIPASIFTLNGPNISHVRIDSDNGHFAAFGAVILDNFTLSTATVPEPQSLVLAAVGGLMLIGYGTIRRRRPGRPRPPTPLEARG